MSPNRLIHALRIGASVKNPTPLKWAGVAVAVAIIALEVSKSYGVFADVTESSIVELVMAALVLYSQIASTEKIGVLPPDRSDPRIDGRVRDQSMSTDADEVGPKYSRRGGFPDGPFFDS